MIPVYTHSTLPSLPDHTYLSVLPLDTPLLRPLDQIPFYLKQAAHELTPVDRQRIFLNARLLFHEMIERLELPITHFRLHQDDRGKPIGLADPHPVYLSLSHTQTHLFALLSPSFDVGLDAEPAGRVVHPGLRSRMMRDEELFAPEVSALSDLQCWVVKESVLKLSGDGLRVAMKEVHLQSMRAEVISASLHGAAIQCRLLELEHHYLAISTYL